MLIGDKSIFAVQIGDVDQTEIGKFEVFLLWCGGIYIGTLDSPDVVGVYAASLGMWWLLRPSPDEYFTCSPEHFFETISSTREYWGDHSIPSGADFDAFNLRLFYRPDEFRFIWRLRCDAGWDNSKFDSSYPRRPMAHTIPGPYFRQVVDELEEVMLQKLGIPKPWKPPQIVPRDRDGMDDDGQHGP